MKKILLAMVAALSLSACTIVINSDNVDTRYEFSTQTDEFYPEVQPEVLPE